MKTRLSREPEKPRADWLAWFLHFVFGLVVGGACGFYLGLDWLPAEFGKAGQLLAFAAGIALVTAGASSHYGDALWMGRSLFGPAEHPRDTTSAIVSLLIGLAGVALVLSSLFLYWAPNSESSGPDSRLELILLLPAGVLLALCIHGFKSGTIIGIGAYVHQHESPFFFWLLFCTQLASGLWLLVEALN